MLGIVAEYNPFHNGHLRHLTESKARARADAVIAVMSGDFVQRGEPALLDKWTRARAAVRMGIDLAVELPFAYACNNAEYFARGAVRILNGLKVVDCLAFGSECGDSGKLQDAARMLTDAADAFDVCLRERLRTGCSYPSARQAAAETLAGAETASVFKSPNDILAVEYLKQLILLDSVIKPIIVKRYAVASPETDRERAVAGATAVRGMLLADAAGSERASGQGRAYRYLPPAVCGIIEAYAADGGRMLCLDDLRPFLIYAALSSGAAGLSRVLSATEGLENRLIRGMRRGRDMAEIVRCTKTKRYTETRIKRLIVHTVMGLTKEDMREMDRGGVYARVLAFSDKGAQLIRRIKKTAGAIPVVTNPNRERAALRDCRRMSEFDAKAADVRTLAAESRLGGFWDWNVHPRARG